MPGGLDHTSAALIGIQPGTDNVRRLRATSSGLSMAPVGSRPCARLRVPTRRVAVPRAATARQSLYAKMMGFSLHPAVRCEAHDREPLAQRCRYAGSPPCRPRPASGRTPRQTQTVHRTICVRARHRPTSAYRPTQSRRTSRAQVQDPGSGVAHQETPPLELMRRLTELILRPRLQLDPRSATARQADPSCRRRAQGFGDFSATTKNTISVVPTFFGTNAFSAW